MHSSRKSEKRLSAERTLHKHCLHHTALQVMTGYGEEALTNGKLGAGEEKTQARLLKPKLKSQVCLLFIKPQAHLAPRGRMNTVTGGQQKA